MHRVFNQLAHERIKLAHINSLIIHSRMSLPHSLLHSLVISCLKQRLHVPQVKYLSLSLG